MKKLRLLGSFLVIFLVTISIIKSDEVENRDEIGSGVHYDPVEDHDLKSLFF